VSKEGSIEAEWDLLTWKELYKLATEVPAAGVWLQGKYYGQSHVQTWPRCGEVEISLWNMQAKPRITETKMLRKTRIGSTTLFSA